MIFTGLFRAKISSSKREEKWLKVATGGQSSIKVRIYVACHPFDSESSPNSIPHAIFETAKQHLQIELSSSRPRRRESEATNNNLGGLSGDTFTNGDQCNHGNDGGEFAFAM